VAVLVVYPAELRRLWSWPRFALASASFVAGALPLLVYNLSTGFGTFRANASFAPEGIVPKFWFLVQSSREGIFAWIMATKQPPPDAHLVDAFVAAALLGGIAWWRRERSARAMLFAVVFMAVVWLQMAVNRAAGASVHHTALLWPFPQIFIALALGAWWPAWGRRLAVLAAAALVAWNAVVLREHYSEMSRSGGALVWTDAIYPLAEFVQAEPFDYYAVDWGILENLVLLDQGRVPVRPVWTDPDRAKLSDGARFLTHSAGNEIFAGANARLDAAAGAAGLRREVVRTIGDSRGKPVFDVVEFR
jgi:hypothetical protein